MAFDKSYCYCNTSALWKSTRDSSQFYQVFQFRHSMFILSSKSDLYISVLWQVAHSDGEIHPYRSFYMSLLHVTGRYNHLLQGEGKADFLNIKSFYSSTCKLLQIKPLSSVTSGQGTVLGQSLGCSCDQCSFTLTDTIKYLLRVMYVAIKKELISVQGNRHEQ